MRGQPREIATVAAMAGCTPDPFTYVMTAFEWGKGDLAGHTGPDKWQAKVLREIGAHLRSGKATKPFRLAVASGHGVGKSALVAWLILWAMSTRPHLAAVVTANTQRQLETKTWRELALWHRRAINSHWFSWSQGKFCCVNHPNTWFVAAVPWSRERPEAFAGLHGRHVMVIYDEASAIADEIWDVSEGAMTTPGAMWLVFGNPTRNRGRFRDCFGKYQRRWHRHQVDARRSRLVNKEQVAEWIADHGLDSDFIRIRVTGQFPLQGNWQFISSRLVEQARLLRGVPLGPLVMGIDVARFGEDQTVFLLRQGEAIKKIERHSGLDTMQVASRAAETIQRWSPAGVFIDGAGVGGGVVDRLKQLGFRVIDVNGGSKATDDKRFANRRAEMWSRVRDWLQAGGCLPDDNALADDLCGPEYGYDPTNRITLEKKDDMRRRGLKSPDAGDALALTFADPVWPVEDEIARPPADTGMRDYDPLKW